MAFSPSFLITQDNYLNKSDYYNILDKDYYQKAIEESNTKKYIFFSDDPEWCMENFKSDDYYFNGEEHSPYADLLCMSLCKNNIIANSSFSWWGAWMNQKEDKKVIAPKVWFNPEIKDRNKNYEDRRLNNLKTNLKLFEMKVLFETFFCLKM